MRFAGHIDALAGFGAQFDFAIDRCVERAPWRRW
jgi:hypothetical protein